MKIQNWHRTFNTFSKLFVCLFFTTFLLSSRGLDLSFYYGNLFSQVNGLRDTVSIDALRSTYFTIGGSEAQASYIVENTPERFQFGLNHRLGFFGDDLGISNEGSFDFRLNEPAIYSFSGNSFWQGSTFSGVLDQTFLYKINTDGSISSIYVERDHTIAKSGSHAIQGIEEEVPPLPAITGVTNGFLEPGSYRMAYSYSVNDQLFNHSNNTVESGTLNFRLSSVPEFSTPSSIGEGVEYPISTTGGDKPWFKSLATSHDGIDSARSGVISNGQRSSIETGFAGPVLVSFWWKVSSETNEDFLKLYLDGVEVKAISGNVDWQQRYLFIPANPHKVEWVYSKSLNGSAGDDAGWVDDIRTYDPSFPLPAVSQIIDFPFPRQDGFSDKPVQLVATASSGLPVSFALLNGPALLRGNILVPIGSGPVTVRATQSGDGAYKPAEPVDRVVVFDAQVPRVLAADTPQMSVVVGGPDSRHVQAIAVQPNGKIIIGGYFNSVNGVPRTNLARFNNDGTLDSEWHPAANLRGVSGLVVHDDALFISGQFSEVNGIPRSSLAKISLADQGTLDPLWDPKVGGLVLSMALVEDGLIVGGTFSQINGKPQHSLAKISMDGTGLPDPDWMPEPNDNVYAMAVYGNDIYFSGIFSSAKGIPIPPLAKATTLGQGGIDLNWNKAFANAYTQTMLATEKSLFLGGLSGLIEFSALDGKVVSRSYPNRIVTALARNGDDLYVATSGYVTDDPANNSRIDKIALSTFAKDPTWNPSVLAQNPGQSGPISTILFHGSDMLVGGDFTSLAGSPGSGIALLSVLEGSPIVTGTTTSRGFQSTTGLNITAHPSDLIETTYFKITDIQNGLLLKADGITQIQNGAFITKEDGSAGLKFQPASGFFGTAQFMVQASRTKTDDGVGGGPSTAIITVLEKRISQTISGAFLNDVPLNVGSVELKYSASSGLPVTFTISGPARLEGNALILTGIGTVTVSARQAGNEVYEPSPLYLQSFVVSKGDQTIEFPSLAEARANTVVELGATASSGLPVRYELVSGDATISKNVVIFGLAGNVTIRALQDGDEAFNAAPPIEQTITVRPLVQSIQFDLPATIQFNSHSIALIASSSSGLPVTFAVLSGPAVINSDLLFLTGGGDVVVSAIQGGNEQFEATHVEKTITVIGSEQVVAFQPVGQVLYPGMTIMLRASADSGLPVTFSLISGNAQILGDQLTVNLPGLITVTAQQLGNENFAPSLIYTQTITAWPIFQNIVFDVLTNTVFVPNETVELHAVASSGLSVSYSVVEGPATVSGNLLTILGAGSIQVQAHQPGNEIYDRADPASQAVFLQKGKQVITFDSTTNLQAGMTYPLNAVASSGLPVTFTIVSGAATVTSSNLLTPTLPGTVVIAAIQAGNTNYEAAPEVRQSINVSKALQTIDFPAIPNLPWNAGPVQLKATSSSGLPVSYEIISGPVTWVPNSTNTIRLVNAGTVRIRAYQAGSSLFVSAEAERTFQITKIAQTLSFTPIPNLRFGETVVLQAQASSGLLPEFAVISGNATLTNNTLIPTGLGTVVLQAAQMGNANYEPAVPLQQTITITKGLQTIQFDAPPPGHINDGPIKLIASASSGLPIRFGIGSGAALLSGDLLTPVGLGNVSIIAMQAGNENYEAATTVERILVINKALQTIRFEPPTETFLKNKSLLLEATASSGLPVRFAVLAGPVLLSGNVLTLVSTGTALIQAFQMGDSTNEPAIAVERSITINKSGQSIDFSAPDEVPFSGQPLHLSAMTDSGLPVSLQIESGPGTIENSFLTWTNSGSIVIRASQAGDVEFNPAPAVLRTINILSPIAPTLNIQLEKTTIVIQWSSNDTNYFVEESASLESPQWSPIIGNSTVVDNIFTIKLEMTGSSRFYRLNRTVR